MNPQNQLTHGIKLKKNGSILFELFMALMILSVGIAHTLRIFSEALTLGRKNLERAQAKSAIEHLVFNWAAHPGNASFLGTGSVTLPLESGAQGYQCEIRSQELFLPSPASESQKESSNIIQRPNSYYQVHFHVTRPNGKPVLDFETVLTKANQ